MPLYADGLRKIRQTLVRVQNGEHSPYVKVGFLSLTELEQINQRRAAMDLLPIQAVIVFNGKHLFKSRCLHDGYSIDEVIQQIASAFGPSARLMLDRSIDRPSE